MLINLPDRPPAGPDGVTPTCRYSAYGALQFQLGCAGCWTAFVVGVTLLVIILPMSSGGPGPEPIAASVALVAVTLAMIRRLRPVTLEPATLVLPHGVAGAHRVPVDEITAVGLIYTRFGWRMTVWTLSGTTYGVAQIGAMSGPWRSSVAKSAAAAAVTRLVEDIRALQLARGIPPVNRALPRRWPKYTVTQIGSAAWFPTTATTAPNQAETWGDLPMTSLVYGSPWLGRRSLVIAVCLLIGGMVTLSILTPAAPRPGPASPQVIAQEFGVASAYTSAILRGDTAAAAQELCAAYTGSDTMEGTGGAFAPHSAADDQRILSEEWQTWAQVWQQASATLTPLPSAPADPTALSTGALSYDWHVSTPAAHADAAVLLHGYGRVVDGAWRDDGWCVSDVLSSTRGPGVLEAPAWQGAATGPLAWCPGTTPGAPTAVVVRPDQNVCTFSSDVDLVIANDGNPAAARQDMHTLPGQATVTEVGIGDGGVSWLEDGGAGRVYLLVRAGNDVITLDGPTTAGERSTTVLDRLETIARSAVTAVEAGQR